MSEYSYLLTLPSEDLLSRLANVAALLSSLHIDIAFVRSAKDPNERYKLEGERDSLNEEKFLIHRILETRTHGSP